MARLTFPAALLCATSLVAGCEGQISGGLAPTPTEAARATACGTHGTVSKMRLLWRSAYLAELSRVLGPFAASAADAVALSPATDKFFTFETAGSLLTDTTLQSLADTADAVAVAALASDARAQQVFGCNARTVTGTAAEACFQRFLTGTGAKLLRRPLSAPEVSDALDFFRAQALLGQSDGEKEGFRQGLASLLLHPDFLFLRDALPAQGTTLEPTSLAARLSFALTGHGPDDELFARAVDGTLSQPEVLAAQVQRLAASSDASPRLVAFHRQWLGYDKWSPAWSPAFLDGVDPTGVREGAVAELDGLVQTLVAGAEPPTALLTSTATPPLPAALAPIYGVPAGSTSLPARAGVLTRVGLLSTGGDDWHVVARGLTVATRLLCRPITPPSFSVADAVKQAEALKVSNAQRIATVTTPAACAGCHTTINALGSARSDFDSLGRAVTTEKHYAGGAFDYQVPAVATADLSAALGQPVSVSGSVELEAAVAASAAFQQCWGQQFVRFALGRDEVTDACLAEAATSSIATGGSMLDAVRAVLGSTELSTWRE